ncbi:MAG: hypothetical protein AB8E15_12370, partial [Bdellovibrionales bacterium]
MNTLKLSLLILAGLSLSACGATISSEGSQENASRTPTIGNDYDPDAPGREEIDDSDFGGRTDMDFKSRSAFTEYNGGDIDLNTYGNARLYLKLQDESSNSGDTYFSGNLGVYFEYTTDTQPGGAYSYVDFSAERYSLAESNAFNILAEKPERVEALRYNKVYEMNGETYVVLMFEQTDFINFINSSGFYDNNLV